MFSFASRCVPMSASLPVVHTPPHHSRARRALPPSPPYLLLSPSALTPHPTRAPPPALPRASLIHFSPPAPPFPSSLAPIPSHRALSLSSRSLAAASTRLTPPSPPPPPVLPFSPRAPFPRLRPSPPIAFPPSSRFFYARDLRCSSPFCFPFTSTPPHAPLIPPAIQPFHFPYRPFSALGPCHTPQSPSLFALPFPSVRAPPLRAPRPPSPAPCPSYSSLPAPTSLALTLSFAFYPSLSTCPTAFVLLCSIWGPCRCGIE
ncbi:hypothetical protein DFH09DRAFT_1305982 [Mycena vulgaris]|nr:hypothetical protein DFH09DRAFT_1305982 [Mycena vulgaris]